jgi:hypothetical protein
VGLWDILVFFSGIKNLRDAILTGIGFFLRN